VFRSTIKLKLITHIVNLQKRSSILANHNFVYLPIWRLLEAVTTSLEEIENETKPITQKAPLQPEKVKSCKV